MGFTISGLSAYTQKATEMFRAGLFSDNISEFATQTGIKYKEFLNFIEVDAALQAGACGLSNSGGTTITERVITVVPLQNNQSYCFDDLYQKALTGVDVAKEITTATVEKISNTVTKTLWDGNALGVTGWEAQFVADSSVVDITGSSAITTSNIETLVAACVAAVTDAMYARGVLTLYVNYKTFNLYKVARLASGLYRDQNKEFGTNEMWLNGYEGQIKIKAFQGISDDTMILTWAENLVIGYDEINAVSSLKWVVDEVTEYAWLKAKFKIGTSYKFPAEIVMWKKV